MAYQRHFADDSRREKRSRESFSRARETREPSPFIDFPAQERPKSKAVITYRRRRKARKDLIGYEELILIIIFLRKHLPMPRCLITYLMLTSGFDRTLMRSCEQLVDMTERESS